MRTKNSVVEIVILGILGLLVIFTLLVPQLPFCSMHFSPTS